MREELSQDPFMKKCIIWHYFVGNEVLQDCEGRIEWQHSTTYAGKRINELYTILPMCHKHHKEQAKYRAEQDYYVIERMEHFNATDSFKEKYPRSKLLTNLD